MEFNKEDIVELIKIKSNLTGDIPKRRAGTILSWFKWVENNFGYLKVIDNKIVSKILIQNTDNTSYADEAFNMIKCRGSYT
jgi:hypothetical protein